VMPAACPVCGSELRRDPEEVVWRCENRPARPGCAEPRTLRVRGAMSIEGLASRWSINSSRSGWSSTSRTSILTTEQLEQLVSLPGPRRARRSRKLGKVGETSSSRSIGPIERSVADLRAGIRRRREGRGDARAAFQNAGPRPRCIHRGAAIGARHRPRRGRIGARVRG
jgi:NAD-dependent DNA ligase